MYRNTQKDSSSFEDESKLNFVIQKRKKLKKKLIDKKHNLKKKVVLYNDLKT